MLLIFRRSSGRSKGSRNASIHPCWVLEYSKGSSRSNFSKSVKPFVQDFPGGCIARILLTSCRILSVTSFTQRVSPKSITFDFGQIEPNDNASDPRTSTKLGTSLALPRCAKRLAARVVLFSIPDQVFAAHRPCRTRFPRMSLVCEERWRPIGEQGSGRQWSTDVPL